MKGFFLTEKPWIYYSELIFTIWNPVRAEKQHSEIRQKQIARAAMALIAEQGMKGLSVAAVARRVGLVPSALYRHFKGKDDILEATIELVRDLLLENVRIVRQESPLPLEQLRLLLVRHIQMVREFQAIPRIIFSDERLSSHSGKRTATYKIIREFLDQVSDVVSQGQQQRYINPDLNPGTVSVMFLGLVQPPVVLWYLSNGKFDLTKHTERAWQIFMKAIRAENPTIVSLIKEGTKHLRESK
ncbi:MAG: TetR/AcrR family transcriptional regulator [Desulfobacca sp.]|nr:TetR/AcrR family transcriptional regulator [Desulfobacca sp.]